jgi:hypothetical protein
MPKTPLNDKEDFYIGWYYEDTRTIFMEGGKGGVIKEQCQLSTKSCYTDLAGLWQKQFN